MHKLKFPVEKMCKVLQVSKSGYYHWLQTTPSLRWQENLVLRDLIEQIFNESSSSYGSPRISAELSALNHKVSRPRVARIMQANGWYAKRKRKFKVTTDSNHHYPVAPNLLDRNFNVSKPNQAWVSDITYIATKDGWMYLTVIIDLFHRKVIGWSMSADLTTENTVAKAWKMAVRNNPIKQPLIFHSDRGVQYASEEFKGLLKKHDYLVKQSMSRKGNCWDNAVAESFFKSLKVELVYQQKYQTKSQAELAIFEWIETWYNTKRRHSYLGHKNINEIEIELLNQRIAA